jgi:hypothetical protein
MNSVTEHQQERIEERMTFTEINRSWIEHEDKRLGLHWGEPINETLQRLRGHGTVRAIQLPKRPPSLWRWMTPAECEARIAKACPDDTLAHTISPTLLQAYANEIAKRPETQL